MTLGLVFGLRSCGKPAASLTNENGAVIEGGEFEKGSVLNVEKIENTAADADTVIAKIEASGVAIKDTENVYIYDISVTKNDVEVQPSGKVSAIPGSRFRNSIPVHSKKITSRFTLAVRSARDLN